MKITTVFFCGIMGRPMESKKLCTCVDILPWVKASGKSGSGFQEWALSGLGAGSCHRGKRGSVGPVFGPLTLWLQVGFSMCVWAGRPNGNPEERWMGLEQSTGYTWEEVVRFWKHFVRRLVFFIGLNVRKDGERIQEWLIGKMEFTCQSYSTLKSFLESFF